MTLLIDQASTAAMQYACRTWHYSGCSPAGRIVRAGVWDDDRFLGVVLFSKGAAPALPGSFGVKHTEIVELTRVALRDHEGIHTSQIVTAAVRWLRAGSPDLRVIVSFADPQQGHHGGIYQAMNWTYTGTMDAKEYFRIRGVLTHPRTVAAWRARDATAAGVPTLDWLRRYKDPATYVVPVPPKHRFALGLDRSMKRTLAARSLPYPRRAVEASGDDAPDLRSGGPGAVPGHRSPGAEVRT